MLITIITFVTFLVSFGLYSLTHDINLVSKDYFPEEIAYAKKLEKIQNVDALKEKITIDQKDNQITILFPKAFDNKIVTGKIKFYFVTSYRYDTDIKIDAINSKQIIDITKYKKGRYFIKIDWIVEGTEYFQEFEITL